MSKRTPARIPPPPATPRPPTPARGRHFAVMVLLAVATVALFIPAVWFDFIILDDPAFISANPQVLKGLSWEGLKWAFQFDHGDYWHPLTWLSLMLDVSVFGRGPWGPHLTNVLFHAANAALVFGLFQRMTGSLWRSAVVAALFAWHPLRVESVAWVTERKDVLSTFFGLLTLIFYARYAQGQARGPWSVVPYLASLICFACGLMSKAMVVTLPFVLLLLDYWPLGRVRSAECGVRSVATRNPEPSRIHSALRIPHSALLWEKLPFFVLSVVSIATTLLTERAVKVAADEFNLEELVPQYSLLMKVGNAFGTYCCYLAKIFWPAGLSIYYPYPGPWSWARGGGAVVLIVGIGIAMVWLARRRPYLFTGWFWFLGMLVPVIGLTRNWTQYMADRFTYLPAIGLFAALVWGVSEAVAGWRLAKVALRWLAGLVLVACAWRTTDQLRHWQNSETILRHSLAATKGNPHPELQKNLADSLDRQGRAKEAMEIYRELVKIQPKSLFVWNNMGILYFSRRQFPEALACFQEELRIFPGYPPALYNLASLFMTMGRPKEAVDHYRMALREYPKVLRGNPGQLDAQKGLGRALLSCGQNEEALVEIDAYLQSRPDDLAARQTRAAALEALNRLPEAMAAYGEVLRLSPGDAAAESHLAVLLDRAGQPDEAIVHYRNVLQRDPARRDARKSLGRALFSCGRYGEAVTELETFLQSEPGDLPARRDYATALAGLNRREEAMAQYREVLRLSPGDPVAGFNLGVLLVREGRPNEAIDHFRVVLKQLPDSRDARRLLGRTLLACGRYGEAVTELETFLQSQPGDLPVRRDYAAALAGLNRREEAITQYREVLRLSPGDAAAQLGLGTALVDLGRREEAIPHLREALRLQPDYPQAREQLRALGFEAK